MSSFKDRKSVYLFISFIEFLLQIMASYVLSLPRYSLLEFSFFTFRSIEFASRIPRYVLFLLCIYFTIVRFEHPKQEIIIISCLGSSNLSIDSLLHYINTIIAYLSISNFISMFWLKIMSLCIKIYNSFHIVAKLAKSSMYMRSLSYLIL